MANHRVVNHRYNSLLQPFGENGHRAADTAGPYWLPGGIYQQPFQAQQRVVVPNSQVLRGVPVLVPWGAVQRNGQELLGLGQRLAAGGNKVWVHGRVLKRG